MLLVFSVSSSHAAGPFPTEVAAMQFGHGARLTDTQGLALYRFDNDLREPGTSTCSGECAEKRPPLIASRAPVEIPYNWSLIEREDGIQQWAYAGRPLYRYARDKHEGSAYGDGDGWTIAFEPIITPLEMSVASTVLGHVLAASNGQTLYVQENQTGPAECTADCLETWLPFEAPWGASDYGDFSIQARDDGVYQWAYKNKPLHRFAGDSERGDINGDGVDGAWQAMVLEPTPPAPSWTTVVGSDGGTLFANSNGMTLYRLMEDRNSLEQSIQGGNHCSEACLENYWTPVVADSKVAPIGYWSVIETKDQSLRWAYKGMLLYTLDLETRPGQLYYTTFRQFQWMKPIMYALPSLQGVF